MWPRNVQGDNSRMSQNLDAEDMFTPQIDFQTPINFLCTGCLGKARKRHKYFLESHH